MYVVFTFPIPQSSGLTNFLCFLWVVKILKMMCPFLAVLEKCYYLCAL